MEHHIKQFKPFQPFNLFKPSNPFKSLQRFQPSPETVSARACPAWIGVLPTKNPFRHREKVAVKFEPLKSLDLTKCQTVGDIVDAMRYCAFGARMVGEVARTIFEMVQAKEKPILVYDGLPRSPLGLLLHRWVKDKWCAKIVEPAEYGRERSRAGNLIVVGPFSERHAEAIYKAPGRAVFINTSDLARPGQIRDGFFPDAVFADPRFIMPLLDRAIEEWLEGTRIPVPRLLSDLASYEGIAAQVARGAKALQAMVRDKSCLRFLTVSGAMTVAKMDLVICDMIEQGMIHAISSTGALMAHGLVSSIGLKHYKYNPAYNDTELARRKLNRVTDTLEPETNLDTVEEVLGKVVDQLDGSHTISPTILNRLIGKYLAENYPDDRGILKSAYLHNVPVFVPAFVDSELGNDIYIHNLYRTRRGQKPVLMDLELDSKELVRMVTEAKRFGIFTIGGGVPRNNVQNVAPLIEIIDERLGITCRCAASPMEFGSVPTGRTSAISRAVPTRKMNPGARRSRTACTRRFMRMRRRCGHFW